MTPSIFELKLVPQTAIPESWPLLHNTLQAYPETWVGEQTTESILASLLSGSFQLWYLVDGQQRIKMVLMTRIVQYPTGDEMEILWAAGEEAESAIHSIEAMERFALLQGCKGLRIQGRPAWTKLMQNFGYEPYYTVIGKKLVGPGKGN